MVSPPTSKQPSSCKDPKVLDSLLDSALDKIEKKKPAKTTKKDQKVGDFPDLNGNLEAEVDKMLKEFSRMMPGETGEALNGKSSSEQIEETFKKLLEQPLDDELDDDLGKLGDMNAIIEQMMSELTSREILYDPFKEMVQKYPSWLEENQSKLDSTAFTQYQGQLSVAREVLDLFDKPDYEQRKSHYQSAIFTLMQTMQTYGAPPEGLLSEAPPGPEDAAMPPPDCKQM